MNLKWNNYSRKTSMCRLALTLQSSDKRISSSNFLVGSFLTAVNHNFSEVPVSKEIMDLPAKTSPVTIDMTILNEGQYIHLKR